MNTIQLLFLILSAIAGIIAAWLLRNKTKSQFLNILLSFSGAYLLGVVVLHLLPEVFRPGSEINPALFILAGFFIQLLIVQFTRGIEHGHMHHHEHFSAGYVFGVFFGLSIHALMEGIPLSSSSISDEEFRPLYYAILVHKFPETFALATVLFFSFRNKVTALILLAAFACMTPVGSFIGNYLSGEDIAGKNNWLIAIVCGTLIHISTTIIFESSGKAHRIGIYKFLAIIAGAAISLLTINI